MIDNCTQSLNFRLRAAPFQRRIATQEGGKPVKERREAERAPACLGGPQRRQRLSRWLRVDKIGKAASATVDKRRDAHERSRSARGAGTLDQRQSRLVVHH